MLRGLMTWRGHAKRRHAAFVAVLLVAGCSPAGPSPTTPPASVVVVPSSVADPSATASSGPSSSPGFPVSPVRWSDCGNGFQCAQVRVPRDYAAPTKGTLNVAMIRVPATDKATRIGSLFINPGGPGGSGVDFVRDGATTLFPPALRKRFDIVGFDPRGVNSSTAIRCIDNLDGQAALDPSPDDAAELGELVASARAYAGECGKRNDTTLPYLSTDAVARDLDALRVAVGDDKLTYLGFSYGTLIGSMYADLFPDHIRAMVLDGAIDPSLDLEGLRAGQAKGFETELRSFLDDCAARTSCAFHEGGRSRQVVRFADGLDRQASRCPRRSSTRRASSARASPPTLCSRRSIRRTRGRPWPRRSSSRTTGTARSCCSSPIRTGAASRTARTRTCRTPTSATPVSISRRRPTSPRTPRGRRRSRRRRRISRG